MSGGFLLALRRCARWQRGKNCIDNRHPSGLQIRRSAIADPLGVAPVSQQTCRLQPSHMARHPRLSCSEAIHQLANAILITVPHNLKCAQPGWFGKRGHQIVDWRDHPLVICVHAHNRNGIAATAGNISISFETGLDLQTAPCISKSIERWAYGRRQRSGLGRGCTRCAGA